MGFSLKTTSVADNLGLPEEHKKKIIQALKVHVEGAVNETDEKRNFQKRCQHTQESFDNFLVALRDLIKTCNYCAADNCINRACKIRLLKVFQVTTPSKSSYVRKI